MRDQVTVDGVVLTRKQIEEAQRKLEEPDPPITPGDVFEGTLGLGLRFMMLNKTGLRALLDKTDRYELCVDNRGEVHTFALNLHKVAIKRGDHKW